MKTAAPVLDAPWKDLTDQEYADRLAQRYLDSFDESKWISWEDVKKRTEERLRERFDA